MLSVIFDYFYTLRNPLVHDSPTWNGGFNYGQLRDGTRIMHWLLPIFIDPMLTEEKFFTHEWAKTHFVFWR